MCLSTLTIVDVLEHNTCPAPIPALSFTIYLANDPSTRLRHYRENYLSKLFSENNMCSRVVVRWSCAGLLGRFY